ncbi:MAG: glucosylglycerol hydrolase [Acidimicrobiia bacterium]|nr:glucosylglycerol hydrolase [Acidimicrobiia bacterium]
MSGNRIVVDHEATARLVAWANRRLTSPFDTDHPPLDLVSRLGAQPEDGVVCFGFWAPQLRSDAGATVELELLEPPAGLDLSRDVQTVEFHRTALPMITTGEFAWVGVSGVTVGNRDRIGTFYRMIVHLDGDRAVTVEDPLALSMPLGAFAPAEVVDPRSIVADRDDGDYYASLAATDDEPRVPPCANLLQVHVPTATEAGTLASLTDWIDDVGSRVGAGGPLLPGDELWLDYDGIELMPVEPTIGFEAGTPSWEPIDADGDRAVVTIRRPATTDWGYDIIISGGAAVNPAMLASGRPHELADLAVALHNFPGGPMRLVIDVVYGHADNQAIGVVPDAWFTGPDMYGQHLDYRNPIVRAHLLEMQRRKGNFGVDGVRVDGAQDFTWWNERDQRLEFHDRYMEEMSAVVHEVAGVRFRPWMIFEDGRPWPKEDWEISSTYRAVIDRQPNVHQWGPLTFAHNTPFLFTFWVTKWWRLREIAEVGSTWISGCANHDTLRRGSQVDPEARINHYLGATLPDVIRHAYDHAAANLLFHAFLPGVPMDFLQASARAPWSFVRNTDHRYAIKVWGEEKRFLDWRVTDSDYDDPANFARLKALGFQDRRLLYGLMAELEAAVTLHGDDVEAAVAAAQRSVTPDGLVPDADDLRVAARAWMDDVHDFCVATRYLDRLDAERVGFNRRVREFRRANRWLLDDLGPDDVFDYRHPTTGTVLFHGVRRGPNGEQVLFVANMEGRPVELVAGDLPGAAGVAWNPELIAPGVTTPSADVAMVLSDAQGVVFVGSSD